MNKLLTREVRKYLYAITVCVFALLGAMDVMAPELIPYWASLVAVVLGISVPSMAAAHLPAKEASDGDAE